MLGETVFVAVAWHPEWSNARVFTSEEAAWAWRDTIEGIDDRDDFDPFDAINFEVHKQVIENGEDLIAEIRKPKPKTCEWCQEDTFEPLTEIDSELVCPACVAEYKLEQHA